MSSLSTHLERLHAGLLYNAGAREIQAPLLKARRLCAGLRSALGLKEKRKLLEELVPNLPKTAIVEPPFHCDMGIHIRIGERCHVAQGCVFLDMGMVEIGDDTLVGAGSLLLTPHHPLDPALRRQPLQYAFPVRIGRNCRLGAGVIVCPGVTIGDNCHVESGSVVTRDLPAGSHALGCPARVVGKVGAGGMVRPEGDPGPSKETGNAQDAQSRSPKPAVPESLVDALARMNAAVPMSDEEARLQKAVFPGLDDGASFCGPAQALHGANVLFGPNSFANYGTIFRDHGRIRLGRHTLLGPNCKLLAEREDAGTGEDGMRDAANATNATNAAATNTDIHIGDDCWLGGSITVRPGVTIGDRCVIGAGSVVTEDIPSDCLAAGHPAKVKRRLDVEAGSARAPRSTKEDGTGDRATSPARDGLTEFRKMRLGLVYDFSDGEILESNMKARRLCASLDAMEPGKAMRGRLEELIPALPKRFGLVPPFRCDHGHGLKLGEGVFFNSGCVVLDSGLVTIGEHCLFGPGCQIYTPVHPMDFLARRRTVERALPVTIGRNCWFGAGALVCPGVTIGDNCVIAAGSVVTRDLPDNALAAGRPARVLRRLPCLGA